MNQHNHDDPSSRDASTSAGTADQDAEAKREAERAAEAVGDEAREFIGTAHEAGEARAREEFEEHSGRAASEVQTVSRALDDAAERLDDEDSPFASHVSALASQLSDVSSRLEEKSLDEVMQDTRRLARDNPGAFLLGSVALGLAASRFFGASSNRDVSRYPSRNDANRGDDTRGRDGDFDDPSTGSRRPSRDPSIRRTRDEEVIS